MALLATSSTEYGYALAARTYAERATRVRVTFKMFCEAFGVEVSE